MATISGGQRLEAELSRIARSLARGGTLRVGFFSNATYPNGTPVAMIAAIHNYGAPRAGIPPRPFFSNMVAGKSPTWPHVLQTELQGNNYDAGHALARLGELIEGQLRQSIRDTWAPPLKPRTVARKGFDKPLIETSHMINSASHEVTP